MDQHKGLVSAILSMPQLYPLQYQDNLINL